ncbi:ATP-binding protein [Desertivirga arenae]|uniref:ATP-binding protein n=1 Tax=Desertivirga arenae TaxID=2810309 RepID=UPI001A979CDD
MTHSNTDSFYTSKEFHTFFENSPRSLVLKADAPRFTILAVSDTYLNLVHKQRREILGKGLFEAFPGSEGDPSEQNSVQSSFMRVIATRVPDELPIFKYEIVVDNTGRKETHYWTNLNEPILDEEGNVAYLINTTTNITGRIRLEQAVEESEARFRIMAEGTNIYIAMADQESNAIYFNQAWSRLTGRTVEDLMAYSWVDLLHPEDKDRYLKIYLDAFKVKGPFHGDFRILNKDGEYRWLLADGSARWHTDGSFAGYVSASIDITEQKQSEQRKNDFISMVSHELKTPLTSMKSFVQVLQRKAQKDGDELTVSMLDKADKQVSRMTRLINGFLNLSRLESAGIFIDCKHVDLAELIKEAKEDALAHISSHQVVFAPVEPTIVNADPDKIAQVIQNLISNAAKYSTPGSTIQVACVAQDGKAVISVKDEGQGICKEDLPKLFERYYRVENNESRHIAGFGIGLYLCCEIIKRHEGNIWAESELGNGSTFYFSIPTVY